MREVNIGPASEFADPGRKVLDFDGIEVGVYKVGGGFYAYLNHCPHMGGPACQGKMMPKVEEIIADDRTSKGQAFSKQQINIVCPWHGYEFDARTGVHTGNPKLRLRPMQVRVSADGDVIVALPEARERPAA
jgi:nitrite reductase/ring-hydroxylating ferredoxin subunit